MARLNFRFALLVAFLVVFIGHGLVTDAKPIEKKEAEEKDAKEATTEVAPKEEEAADDAADDASDDDAAEEDASTQPKPHKQKSAVQKKCKKGINKNCGKREFRIQGALRPFSHNPGHSVDQENEEKENEEDEEEPEEKEEGEEHEEREETPEDRGYDEDAQRNVMAQDGGPSEDLEGAFSHSASAAPEKPAKHLREESSNIKEKDDEERIEQDIINQEAEPEQRDTKNAEQTLQNPSPEQSRAANIENGNEGGAAENAHVEAPHSDDSNAIDPAVAAAAMAKTESEAKATAANAAANTEAGAQGETAETKQAETKSTPSADVHDDGEMREINEGNYDHHCSDCPFEHEQIMQVSHGHHKGFLHGHGTYGHGCGCGCEHGALGPSGTRIGCDCAPAGHLATFVTDTKNTPACPNLNCANICGNVNLGLPHPCCQNSNAQDANKIEAEKAYCPSSPTTAETAETQKDNSTSTAPATAEAQKDSSTPTASGEEPSSNTDSNMQKFKESVAKVGEAKGESSLGSEGEVKHPEKRSDPESEEVPEEVVDIVGSRLDRYLR